MQIKKIVIHCSATANGKPLTNFKDIHAPQRIDQMHAERGFKRSEEHRQRFNSHLKSIGYHFILDVYGAIETGRSPNEMGAHVKGHNQDSLGICLVGTDKFTKSQWQGLKNLILELKKTYPHAEIIGHRDLSPDLDGDGIIEPHEWVKLCPCFEVKTWLESDFVPDPKHICGVSYA